MAHDTQQTIAQPVTLTGRGLFSGKAVTAKFCPAPANHGVVFVRSDLNLARVPALIDHVVQADRHTCLKHDEALVETPEHCLSALAAMGVDNVLIEMDAPELPLLDGSAKPYVDALRDAGITEQDEQRTPPLIVTDPIVVQHNGCMIAALSHEKPGLELIYELDYGEGSAIDRQVKRVDVPAADFDRELAPARTFVLEAEAVQMRDAGVGEHLGATDVLVIGDNGPIGGNEYRFPDEPVRHKLIDLIGDLSLAGAPIQARIFAFKTGHEQNHALVRQLIAHQQSRRRNDAHGQMDIRKISRILPHRYPMLLVDRVLEISADARHAVGIKNVTINEPYFQGHYPGTPMMPGVLIIEAMAQLSGTMISQTLEHTGRVPVLVSLDRVRIRRAVIPGDQLRLETDALHVRSRMAHVRGRALVDGELAAEAEIKFMLVDDQVG